MKTYQIPGIALIITGFCLNLVHAQTLNDKEQPYWWEMATPSVWIDPAADTDGDGLSDWEEVFIYGTDALSDDWDQDGVNDGDEINVYHTDPFRESTDGDPYDDGQELFGFSPVGLGNLGGDMPAYVQPPGDNVFVAAYPVIDIIIDNHISVEAIERITFLEGGYFEGTQEYSVANTEGHSVSIGTGESHTVGEWVDVSNSEEDRRQHTEYQQDISSSEEKVWTSHTEGFSTEVEVGTELGVSAGLTGIGVSAKVSASVKETATTQNTQNNYQGSSTSAMTGSETQTERIRGTTRSQGAKKESTSSTTITRTSYNETTVTNAEAISQGQNWSTATTVDHSNAGILSFSLWIKNTGSDVAEELDNVRFNVDIGDRPRKTFPPINEPAFSTNNVAVGETIEIGVNVVLTLEDMGAIDEGDSIKIVVADYSYGQKELGYMNALNRDVLVEIDDGVADGDESIDYYMTWANYGEYYLDVLKRLNEEVPIGHPLNKRREIELTIEPDDKNPALEYITSIVDKPVTEWSWWNIYTEDLGDIPDHFTRKLATRGTRMLLVYNQDSDHDNYNDRTEQRIGTNHLDPNSHPFPILITGILEEDHDANTVVSLKFTNLGNYDAYGIDAILYSPDDTTSISDSLIGGGGRIEAGRTFIPNDTMTFRRNTADYTEPVVLVKYNDPQGPHSFITPLLLGSPDEPLDGRADDMLPTEIMVRCNEEFSYHKNNWMIVDYSNPGPSVREASVSVYYQYPDGMIIDSETRTVNISEGNSLWVFRWKPDDTLGREVIGQKLKAVVLVHDYQGVEIAGDVVKFDVVSHTTPVLLTTFSGGAVSQMLQFDTAGYQTVNLQLPTDCSVSDAQLTLEMFCLDPMEGSVAWLEVGEIDGQPEWIVDANTPDVGVTVLTDMDVVMSRAVDSGVYENIDCNGISECCSIPLTFYSDVSGYLNIKDLRVIIQPTSCLKADLDDDSVVSPGDLLRFVGDYLTATDNSPSDLDSDGRVTLSDFALLGNAWLDSCWCCEEQASGSTSPIVGDVGIDDGEPLSLSWQVDCLVGVDQCVVLLDTEVYSIRSGGCQPRVVFQETMYGLLPGIHEIDIVAIPCEMTNANFSSFSLTVAKQDINWAFIPAGAFDMGDSFGEGNPEELPVHRVMLNSFYMGRHEITNQQYCDYLNDTYPNQTKLVNAMVYSSTDTGNNYPYCITYNSSGYNQIEFANGNFFVKTKADRFMANDPVVQVSWYGAAAYCNWLSQQDGFDQCYDISTWSCDFSRNGYRLPTEAEWEYAARGGLSGKRFPWGDTIWHSRSNYYSSSLYAYDVSPTRGYHPVWDDGISPYTSPVGSFPANGFGLYDMVGNVWEWCNDWYSAEYYNENPLKDNPRGPTSGSHRVLRGGNRNEHAINCRVSNRNHYSPMDIGYNDGFRVVRGID